MRKILTTILLLLITTNLINAATYYSIASGIWTNATGTVWSTSSGGSAVSSGTYPAKGDVVYLEGHAIVLDSDLSTQPGIELYVDLNSSLTGTGTEGILIKAGGTLQVLGYLEVLSINLKNGASVNLTSTGTIKTTDWLTNDASITVDGTLEIVGLFTNTGTVSGAGSLTAGSFTGTGTIFGIVANTISDGATIGGYTWQGTTSTTYSTTSNWVLGIVPSLATHDVVIPNGLGNYPTISTTGNNARNIIIETGASLTLGPNADLTVSGKITNSANTELIIQSTSAGNGSLIHENETPPPSTVEQYITEGAWHLVACPTNGGNTSNFYDVTNDGWFLKHTEATDTWTYLTNIDSAITRNQGFSYWVTTNRTVEFTGTLTKIDQDPVLSYTSANEGWNLLGNPFSSAIDWDNPGWGSNTTGSVYIWDRSIGDYAVWNGSAGALTNGTIPMAQGFFVKATSAGAFTIPKAARFHSSQPFYKSNNNSNPSQYVHIQMSGSGHINTVVVGFPENGTNGFDYRGDADKLYSSSETPQLFAMENNKELCINANAPLLDGESKTVPLHLVQVIDGEYQLSISKLDQLENTSIVLEDVKTGITQDFRENTSYNFEAYHGDEPNRFLLHFAHSPNGVEQQNEFDSNIQIYSFGKNVYIRSTESAVSQNGDVIIYDLMGREIAHQKIEGTHLIKLPVNITNNYIVVKVVKSGATKTQKLYIK